MVESPFCWKIFLHVRRVFFSWYRELNSWPCKCWWMLCHRAMSPASIMYYAQFLYPFVGRYLDYFYMLTIVSNVCSKLRSADILTNWWFYFLWSCVQKRMDCWVIWQFCSWSSLKCLVSDFKFSFLNFGNLYIHNEPSCGWYPKSCGWYPNLNNFLGFIHFVCIVVI